MGDVYCNDEAIQAIQQSSPEKITGEKCPEGAENDLGMGGAPAIIEHQSRRERTIPVVLVHMLLKIGIGIMQEIALEVADPGPGMRGQGLMYNVQGPGPLLPMDDPDLFIRIPAAMPDPFTTIIVKTVHRVAIIGKSLLFGCPDAGKQSRAEQLIGIQE
jgi:hypothetical protein